MVCQNISTDTAPFIVVRSQSFDIFWDDSKVWTYVCRICSKDVRLPVQLQRAMAAEAEATREARAKVIAAEGEQKASKALREASQVISDSPAALQLRYLQVSQSLLKNKLRKRVWYTTVREMQAEPSSSEEKSSSHWSGSVSG